MLNRKLSMAWEAWQQNAAEMKRQQELLEYAVRKFQNAKMFAAWNTWRSWAEEKDLDNMEGPSLRRAGLGGAR